MEIAQLLADNVKRLLAEKGWTQRHLATLLELEPPQITRIVQGMYQPRGDTLQKLADVFGVSPASLLAEKSSTTELAKSPKGEKLWPVTEAPPDKIQHIPDIGWVGAGLRIDPVNINSDAETVPVAGLGPGDYVSFRVKGNSMIGHNIADGMRVFVRRQPGAENGEIVVARIDGNYLLKVFKVRRGGKMELESADDKTDAIPVDEETEIIGVLSKWEGVPAKPRKRK